MVETNHNSFFPDYKPESSQAYGDIRPMPVPPCPIAPDFTPIVEYQPNFPPAPPPPPPPATKGAHPAQRGYFPCPDCGKVFNWKFNMNRHRNLECGKEPQFSCPHCDHRAKRRADLQRHIRSRHTRFLQAGAANNY